MISLASVSESLESSGRAVAGALTASMLNLHGAHGRPMTRLTDAGQTTAWVLGDYGIRSHGPADGYSGVFGVGAGHNFGPVQLNATVGQSRTRDDLVFGGRVRNQSDFVMLEGIVPLLEERGLFLTVNGYHQWGDVEVRRGYLDSAGQQDASSASPDLHGYGVRARVDWVDAWEGSSARLSPYADLSYSRVRLDSYREAGGSLPAEFDRRRDSVTEVRAGSELALPIPDSVFEVTALAAVAHRFDSDGARTSGRMVGNPFVENDFDLDGRDYDQTWVRGGIGIEGPMGPGDFSVMLNGTTTGEMESGWLAASYRVDF
ncbi:autotransporter outer membrane beta-barrel domain-containing protein [Thioalkalivibrio sp. ALJ24]|uniref:autotransporter outer membrane beta-barrel domain-containing protein n=1 Tax=Thioalkalivibrio sp. ALJ24 TaxID=545276 RepID=UPI0003683DEF|nr:autotransporter outer membrane beta-barrel domain-containing protein [Thioalkalivibrio sp. ALJ24]